jgi:4-carboxymuconolactone decarboxylase
MYLPEIFKTFMENYPDLAQAQQKVGHICSEAGPLGKKEQHLIQLGISIGMGSKGGIRSHARRAIEAGASKEEVIQTVLLSMTIVGFPAMIAAYGWVDELFRASE